MNIEINLSLRRLKLFDRTRVHRVYPIAIGKPSTPTPPGNYHITRKIINPGGILGSRWLELSIPSDDGPYGIHGTTQPYSIGKAVSNGCVRMYNQDVEEVFSQTRIGTRVLISSSQYNDNFAEMPTHYSGNNEQGASYIYIVQPGDSLWRIANRFQVSVEKLQQLNGIADPALIFPGQKLILQG